MRDGAVSGAAIGRGCSMLNTICFTIVDNRKRARRKEWRVRYCQSTSFVNPMASDI
jgi:hypothetical protein